MKKLLIALVAVLPNLVFAAGPSVPLEKADIDLSNKVSLQRGLGYFQQYCAGCHSQQYQRYNRVAQDLGISTDDMRNKYMSENAKVGDHMKSAIPQDAAAKWFGATPPDLTMVSRVRGDDWVYSYLKGFYQDESRPFGVNNKIFPMVGMPHVLEGLQGTYVLEETTNADGSVEQILVQQTTGEISAEEYDGVVRDITAFLAYSAEPVKLERQRLGMWVLGFLFIFFIFAFMLKKEYWKDIH